jgi:type VI secretion system protein ImpB
MEDFSPAAVASKVGALQYLLRARTQLANLQTYMDGKSGAEELVRQLLRDPEMLRALAQLPPPEAAAGASDASDVPRPEAPGSEAPRADGPPRP